MTSAQYQVDVSDNNDANGIANYIYCDLDYVCAPDQLYCYWYFKPQNANVTADLVDVLIWLCYSNDCDNTACDFGGAGEQWPNVFYGLYTYTQSNVDTYQNFPPNGYGDPGDILTLAIWQNCSDPFFNPVVVTAPGFAIGNGTYYRVGEASNLSINYPRFQMTNLGDPGTGSGNSQADPIQFTWEDMSVWNESHDGTIGFGPVNFAINDPPSYITLQAGKWYKASFGLRTNF